MSACVEWAVAARAFEDRPESGDHAYTIADDDWAFAAIIDGLGHGAEAEHAALTVIAAISAKLPPTLAGVFTLSHAVARKTRGVAMTAMRYEHVSNTLSWLGVGNVEAVCLRRQGRAQRMLCHPGVVGYRLPARLRAQSLTLEAGDWLAAATDGVDPELLPPQTIASAEELARALLDRGRKGTDDALVWAGRVRETR